MVRTRGGTWRLIPMEGLEGRAAYFLARPAAREPLLGTLDQFESQALPVS